MLTRPSFKKSLIVEQFQGNYLKPFDKISKVGIQVVFNILTAICTEVNHTVVSIHDYLAVLQTVGKVVNVYQKTKRPKDASLGYSNIKYLLSSFQQM